MSVYLVLEKMSTAAYAQVMPKANAQVTVNITFNASISLKMRVLIVSYIGTFHHRFTGTFFFL